MDEKTLFVLDQMVSKIETNEFGTIYFSHDFKLTEKDIKIALYHALAELYKRK